jgi:hypothetical protein
MKGTALSPGNNDDGSLSLDLPHLRGTRSLMTVVCRVFTTYAGIFAADLLLMQLWPLQTHNH